MLRLGMMLPWSQGRIQVANEINEMAEKVEDIEPEAEEEEAAGTYVQLPLPLMPASTPEYGDYGLAEEGEAE